MRVETSISVEDGRDVIRNFIEAGKFGITPGVKLDIRMAESFDTLPEEVRKAAENTGGTEDNIYTILHQGASIWLILDAHYTREQLETSIR